MKKPEASIDKQRQMPLTIFQSVRGPIIGRAQQLNARTTRLYAPAHVGSPTAGKVLFMPLLFCEEYLDVNVDSAAFFGTHPVPDVIAQGYESYFAEFHQGSYKMKPLLVEAGVKGAPVEADDSRVPSELPKEEGPCGSCGHPSHTLRGECGVRTSHSDDDGPTTYCECTAGRPLKDCRNCKHPGHPQGACTVPVTPHATPDNEGVPVPCGCNNYSPALETVPGAPTSVDIGDSPTKG